MQQRKYSAFFNHFDFSDKIYRSQTILEAFIEQEGFQRNSLKILLKDEALVIEQKTFQGEFHPTFWLPMAQTLKFRRIVSNREPLNQPHLIGFSLVKKESQTIDIHLHFEDITQIWIKYLGKKLTEIGFSDHFIIKNKIGSGATATVYEVVQNTNGNKYAAKFFSKQDLLLKSKIKEAMENQIQMLRNIDHNNIVKYFGVYQEEQGVYILLQNLTGGNLLKKIVQKQTFELYEIIKIMKGIAKGLSYLHSMSIAHRDIKLQNILFRNQESYEPVIADFGLAVFIDQMPYKSYVCGTPGFMAPQILKMKKQTKCDPICDIFSAGVILHVLLTKCFLFEGVSIQDLYLANHKCKINFNDSIYKDLDSEALILLVKMLMKKPQSRITAEQMLTQEFLQTEQEDCCTTVLTPRTEDSDQYCF